MYAEESPLWTAKYDYAAQGEDELSLRKGDIVVLLSKDVNISGDDVSFPFKLFPVVSHNINVTFRVGGLEK